ncbi:MAG: hypothetical protein CR974_01475 [Gammaproteobacteria bacterium]|nr:MAG: hypothetical protein CR974_01475 [Gammaproteobacteria bacterium]
MNIFYRSSWFALIILGLGGCATDHNPIRAKLTEIESLALCQDDAQGEMIASKVRAEYGFKRFADNAFRPVLAHKLFGHELRVIELSEAGNKLYVAGNPSELAYNFRRLLPELSCEQAACQAPLDNGKNLLLYKANVKKSKDTTVVECTRPVNALTTEK